jgi:hypothetical protein
MDNKVELTITLKHEVNNKLHDRNTVVNKLVLYHLDE